MSILGRFSTLSGTGVPLKGTGWMDLQLSIILMQTEERFDMWVAF